MEYVVHLEMRKRIERDYVYHKPTGDEQTARYAAIREKAKELCYLLVGSCPESRELSKALTDLDSVVMFANAAIARNESL